MTNIVGRLVIAAAMLASGAVHAYLYLHDYQHIPVVGTGFLIQASVFCAIGVLVLGGPAWFIWASGILSAGALVAFVLSRTVGLAGFIETGWQPAPYALLSAVAEVVTVVTAVAWVVRRRHRAEATVS